jgi:hypothetical protein
MVVELASYITMEKREPRVYYLAEREDKKAMLIFDAGYAGGDIHIYEHREMISSQEIEEEMKTHYRLDKLSKETLKEVVGLWIDKKYGHLMSWKLTSR